MHLSCAIAAAAANKARADKAALAKMPATRNDTVSLSTKAAVPFTIKTSWSVPADTNCSTYFANAAVSGGVASRASSGNVQVTTVSPWHHKQG